MKRTGPRRAGASTGLFLTGLRRSGARREPDRFPLSLPIFRSLERLDFRARVTFLVGENGCGKSTLLEGLAAGTGADLKFGTPLLKGASISAEVVGTVQGPKLVVQKLRRRKNSRRKTGHRQIHTKVRIGKIAV